MKNFNIKQIFLVCILATTIFSCSKEFDTLPGNQITQEILYQSEEGFQAATNGLYATLQNPFYYGGSMITIPELYTPYSISGGYDDPTLSRIFDAATGVDDVLLESTNPRLRNIWTSIYNTIRACNIMLQYGKTSKPAVFKNETVWNNLKGQALGIRALAHFDLLRLFGQHWNNSSIYGIPLMIDKIPTPSDKPARNTVGETYSAILKDLDDAFLLLTGDNSVNPILVEGSGRNYIDSLVIKSLKARVLLYQGTNKTEAARLAQEVINNASTLGIGFSNNLIKFYTTRNSSEENIFELSFSNQNSSNLNLTTFKNATALVNDLILGIDTSIINPYFIETGDLSADFSTSTGRYKNIYVPSDAVLYSPRTNKYASLPALKNNPAYVIRLAEMYLILAEANNFNLNLLTPLRTARGVTSAKSKNDANGMFAEIIAELNFEGAHVMCAKTRLNINNFQTNGKGIFPIPQAEVLANPNIKTNP